MKRGSDEVSSGGPLSCLALVTGAFGAEGGIAQFNRDLLRALDRTGRIGQVLVLPRLGDAPSPDGYPSLLQARSCFNKFGYAAQAMRCALIRRPDIVLSGHLYHSPLARLAARMTGARLVSVLHGTEIWQPVRRAHLEALLASDLVICVSEDTRQRFLEKVDGQPGGTVAVLHNTVEDRFHPGDRKAGRTRFGLDEIPIVLTVGHLDARAGYTGHDRIIPIISRLKAEGRPARYLIAGKGPDRPRLEKLVADYDVTDLVSFLGYMPDEALPDLYRASDVFVMPSTGEGFGIVYLEAMACGTPALGLDLGGAKEALGPFGKAVQAHQLEEALVRMLSESKFHCEELSSAVRNQFGRSAFERRVSQLMSGLFPSGERTAG
jgi:phosphatidylinositol alpha-1,6-mannosyltransferase